MARENINDILAFLAVARERSFTRAAAKLGVSQSALSHTVRGLEARMGLRLLTRTTRSVSPTDAGERLLNTVGPRWDEIEAELSALAELRDKPAGTIRITTTDYAADMILWPKLSRVLPGYPDLKIEMIVDYGLADIVADRYDIGVRFGDQVAKDMIAVRIGPDVTMVIVGSPGYLARQAPPKKPQDLLAHNCITLRLPTRGGLYAWELKKGKRELQVRVDGQLTCNGVYQMITAAVSGAGLAFVPEELAREHMAAGRLQRVLADWCPTFPGLHIFYASRRESSRAMAVVVDALRYRP
ncbi:transcriptional regulator, LysR family [Variovorax sp. OK605]|uniref:LysR family transcriptional regulator n=1 Tax=unclassified Variovorax TaxID=663243 RepID=UPI0008B270FE|nr:MULTISPECIES: LysR family transcriptional regulator [unclassified Variovorax]SEK16347.1 transcriptional regulator, LysR family [Variovorax sp. OK202]SFE38797.1 transcriptional regulator, LysR family [Variovorax sp. OK212]SFP63968.1 transcriptional regulator, LysR family [Variovorax sp. OK605]